MVNILLGNVHTPFLYNLAKTGHKIYNSRRIPGGGPWESEYLSKPSNLEDVKSVNLDDIDIVISQVGHQLDFVSRLGKPVIIVEHNAVYSSTIKHPAEVKKLSYPMVFVAQQVADIWQYTRGNRYVIDHCSILDADDYPTWIGDKKEVITVSNKFKGRAGYTGYDHWQEITKGLSRFVIGYENESIGGEFLTKSEFLKRLVHARCYFYTHPYCFPNLAVLDAMAVGIPLVLYKSVNWTGVFNASDDYEVLRHKIETWLSMSSQVAHNVASVETGPYRQSIENYYNRDRFIKEWNEVLDIELSLQVKR